MQVRRDARLAGFTTLAVGGPIDRLVEVADADELVGAVHDADAAGRPLLVLGGGSNVVAPDEGWPGDVVLVRSRGVQRRGDELVVQAGEDWDELVALSV
ncbi:MAG: FAD-binding protein, partial [Actinobacteria bacterium]|nr:FAD-binding protein [Actinomycetota bacterium]